MEFLFLTSDEFIKYIHWQFSKSSRKVVFGISCPKKVIKNNFNQNKISLTFLLITALDRHFLNSKSPSLAFKNCIVLKFSEAMTKSINQLKFPPVRVRQLY